MGTDNGNGAAIASQLASYVCQTMTTLHQQNPALLAEPVRKNWHNSTFQKQVTQKLTEKLADIPAQQQPQKCQQAFSQLFDIAFLDSPECLVLKDDLNRLLQTAIPVTQPAIQTPIEGAIAILLLDAENLQLTAQQEDYLSKLCQCPLQVKIAFANWKKLGKHDEEFHQRDYDLIHVPSGNDMADGKMIAVGSSLREHYPDVQEVLVCSSDKVMTSLCTKLRQQGLTVYKIQKQQDSTLSVSNSITGQTSKYPEEVLPALENCIKALQEIVWDEQKKQTRPWIQLSIVSMRFHKRTGFSLTSIVNHYMPGKRARDLFIDNPKLFSVHKPSDEAELYISLFSPLEIKQPKQEKNKDSLSSQSKEKQSPPKANKAELQKPQTDAAVPFKKVEQLEAAIVSIIKSMETDEPSGFVTIAKLGGLFRQQYQVPITQAIKQLKIGKKYPAFLQSCQCLDAKKQGNDWVVKVK